MVAVSVLEELDKNGVAEILFREARLEGAGPPCSLLDFQDKAGSGLTAMLYPGPEDNPHLFYFPAEYETDSTLNLLGTGLVSVGFSMVALAYRAGGQDKGKLSFQKMFEDAGLFYDCARSWMQQQGRTGHVVLMGRSFGTALALDQAVKKERDVLCLVMESAFDAGRLFLEHSGIDPALIPPDGPIFGNRSKMALFKKPVLFIHSPRDVIQSLTEVEWLVAESRSKATAFQIAPSGTRQELSSQVGKLYLEVVQQWVNLRRGVRPSRKRRPVTMA